MNTQMNLSSFLLIDGSQLAVAELPVPTRDGHRTWLTHIYEEEAAAVSPLVIDIAAANAAGASEEMTGLANAMRPQLHASLIETTMSLAELTHHLRRFIMIRTADGRAYTLRFADCSVLPILATVLAPAQWAALLGPIARWCVHGFDGALTTLAPTDSKLEPSPTPLVLSDEQVAALAEATAPCMVLAHLRDMNHGVALPGSVADQHRWATEARFLWRSIRNADDIVLRWLTKAALDTDGKVLQQSCLPALLVGADLGAIRVGLQANVDELNSRTQMRSD